MISARSHALDVDDEEQIPPGGRPPTLVNLHFIRSALRRRWLVCVLSPVFGLLVAAAFLVAFPVGHHAKASLQLAHRPDADPPPAMATDVSLLRTRTVARTTIANLGLAMTPDEFLKNLTVEPVSSEILWLTLSAPSDAEATRRLAALTSVYLTFRAEHLTAQSNAYIIGMQQRIEKLQGEVADLSRRVDQLAAGGSSNASKLGDTISQRSFVQGRIDTLQQSIEDATLQNTAVVSSSVVVDPAAAEPEGAKRRIALVLASGLIGGAALGCGTVLFFAITSDRLRRRSDVAAALEVPVPMSVGRITSFPKRWLWFPPLRTVDRRRDENRQRLAHAIEMELPVPGRSGRLAVVCLDNSHEVRFAVAAAATDLATRGCSVAVIDLTKNGVPDLELGPSLAGSTHTFTLLRPSGVPALASGAADLRAVGPPGPSAPSFGLSDVNLVLADLDPSVGADHLMAWTSRVIVVVTAGRSSAERVRTAADLVRTAGLELRLAALLHTERTDDSSGTAAFDRPSPIHLVEEHDRSVQTGESVDQKQDTAEGQAGTDERIAVPQDQPAKNEVTASEATTDDKLTHDDEPTVETTATIYPDENTRERPTPGGRPSVDEELTAAQGATVGLPQTAADEQTHQEQLIDVEDQIDEELAADDQIPSREQTTDLQVQVVGVVQPTNNEQMIADQGEPAKEEAAPETELMAEAEGVLNHPEETKAVPALLSYFSQDPVVHLGSASGSEVGELDTSRDWRLDGADPKVTVEGWHLYIDAYPPEFVGSTPSPEYDEKDSALDDIGAAVDPGRDGSDDGARAASIQPSPTVSENGEKQAPTTQPGADGNGRDRDQRPDRNSQVSNGPRGQRTGTRPRGRKTRLK